MTNTEEECQERELHKNSGTINQNDCLDLYRVYLDVAMSAVFSVLSMYLDPVCQVDVKPANSVLED